MLNWNFTVVDSCHLGVSYSTGLIKDSFPHFYTVGYRKSSLSMARAVEPYANITAQELLGTGANCFGWVMKETTSGLRSLVKVLGWPWYYMILHSGCLYLYQHSDDENYTEVIPLTNYRACDAPEVKKYTWAFKLINESYLMKTLFFAVDSEFDLNRWREAIMKDKKDYCRPVSEVDPAEEHYTINTDQTNPSCSLSIPRRKPNAATFPHNLKPSRNDPSDVLVGQASISSGTSKVHSMPSHLGTQEARKQCPLLRPSQENRSTQSNVPPWFGNQEPRTMPLPKRPHAQKKNEPVQFFERSLLEVEAQGPPELPCSSRPPMTASGSTPTKFKALGRGTPDGRSVRNREREEDNSSLTLIHDMDSSQAEMLLKKRPGVYILRKSKTIQSTMVLSVGTSGKVMHYRILHDEEQGYSLGERGTPRFPDIQDLLNHYSSFDLPLHDLKLTMEGNYK